MNLVSRAMRREAETSRFRGFCRTFRLYLKIAKQLVALPFKPRIELRDPQQVLRSKLGDDLEVLEFKTEALVKWGDNFGSTIVKASVDVKRGHEVEKLHLVAKMLPPTKFQRESFQCDITLAKEIFFYEEIIPEYKKLCPDEFDIVPKFYGGRLAIKSGVVGIDEGAVILLENLKETGYVMQDRLKGLSMEQIRIVVPVIAKFHTVGLAIKHKNPVFFSKMQQHAKPLPTPNDLLRPMVSGILKLIKSQPQLRRYYEQAKSLYAPGMNENCLQQVTLEPEDPWACLVHRDLWINNLMFRENDGPKIIDFQTYCFGSPMSDLLYFLFTGMQRELADFDQVLELYRITAYEVLQRLECDAGLFGKESFYRRIKVDAASEFYHLTLMAKTVETRSVWEMVKPCANSIRRIRRILEVYDAKAWF